MAAVPKNINPDDSKRLVPLIPLEVFYRSLRKLTGTAQQQYDALVNLLDNRYGPKGVEFLVELFFRSVQHSDRYSNIEEPFHDSRKGRVASKYPFAKQFVKKLISGSSLKTPQPLAISFVDYEVYPFRTTLGCCENGKPATRNGSGGMDLLLSSDLDGVVLPAVGEIKAATETVGPTFALIQSLMYAAQILTTSQLQRLSKHYEHSFGSINPDLHRVDLIILLQDYNKSDNDLKGALSIASRLNDVLSEYLRQIRFLHCRITEDSVVCDFLLDLDSQPV